MSNKFLGELIGTYILVFLGCGIVGLSLLYPEINLTIIAVVWGIGVYFGIVASIRMSDAHLNPAVSFAFLLIRESSLNDFFKNLGGQIAGAGLAAATLFLCFNSFLTDLETSNNWNRGETSGLQTGKMFGEYYDTSTTTLLEAFFTETFGTFILVFMIFQYVKNMNTNPKLVVVFISLTVTMLILFLAPITQCGINPARDFAPRALSYVFGWKKAFDLPQNGALVVYVLGPFVGATLAVLLSKARQLLTIN